MPSTDEACDGRDAAIGSVSVYERRPEDRERDTARVKDIWNRLVPIWDDRSFYDFVATSYAFGGRSFQHREIFGQVGFGTGGWDSDYPNSMLEILRVVATECDENQRFIEAVNDREASLFGLSKLLNLDPRQKIELADTLSFFETPQPDVEASIDLARSSR